MLNLFLFALHEDHVVPTENPVRRMRLSYLVTARAPRVRQEHELLGEALRIALNGELPVGCFGGTLDHGGHPVLLSVADTGPGALWSNLGMPARAAFVLRVSVPVPHVTGREFSRRLRSSG
jgi:hypothetical protein